MAGERRRLRGTNFDGTPVYAPTREEMAREWRITEEFDEIDSLPDGRIIVQTAYDSDTGVESFHEADYAGNIFWDKPVDQADVERASGEE